MKIIQINENLKINIEMIYSLEKNDNQFDIDEWEISYKKYIEEFTKNPPLLPISENEIYQPDPENGVDKNKVKLYGEALKKYILDIIGEKPYYCVEYKIILCTGLKINIDKIIYDKLNEYLNEYT